MKRSITTLAAAAAATTLVITGIAVATAGKSATQTPTATTVQNGVVAEAVRTDGTEEVSTTEAATPGTATQPRIAGTPTSCADGAYSLSGYKVNGSISFGYNPTGAPTTVARYASLAVRNSLAAVSSGANRCKLPARVNTAGIYTGASAKTPQLNTAGACTGNDGVNVVGWGTLPVGYLAITCIYFAGGKVINADVMISKRYNWFLAKPTNCTNTYDLQSVLTHEQGHTFGLSHVDPTNHGTATMGTLINPCDTTKRTLGRGDYGAMVRLYGTK